MMPTRFEDAVIYQNADKVMAVVLEVDNSAVRETGLICSGEQVCSVLLKGGQFQGETVEAVNLLSGSISQDKQFAAGDRALVVVSHTGSAVTSVTMIDHFRIGWEALLAVIFTLLLILFAGSAGLRAMLTFLITVLCLWKVMIPYCLKGGNAVLGGILFTKALKIHGAIMADSESLLYSGYERLNLTEIFMASIFIGASGAMMDLAVDITSGICEVARKNPGIGRWELVGSGMRIGQAAMGTMTTTLLLAYAGSCLTQFMVFMAQGTPVVNILNYKYIASEILQTLAGSFALVTVAPFTAVAGGLLLGGK